MHDLNGRPVRCSRQETVAVEAAPDPCGTDLPGPVRRMPWRYHPARTIHEQRPGAARMTKYAAGQSGSRRARHDERMGESRQARCSPHRTDAAADIGCESLRAPRYMGASKSSPTNGPPFEMCSSGVSRMKRWVRRMYAPWREDIASRLCGQRGSGRRKSSPTHASSWRWIGSPKRPLTVLPYACIFMG